MTRFYFAKTIFFLHNIEKEAPREEKENRKDVWDIDAAEEVERIERVQLKEAQSPERSGPDDEHIEGEASREPGEGLGLDPSQRKRPAYEEMSFRNRSMEARSTDSVERINNYGPSWQKNKSSYC